jgi:hypothetical protein
MMMKTNCILHFSQISIRHYPTLSDEAKREMIVSGKVQLMDIKVGHGIRDSNKDDYDNVMGYFCALNWSLHKNDPSKCEQLFAKPDFYLQHIMVAPFLQLSQ